VTVGGEVGAAEGRKLYAELAEAAAAKGTVVLELEPRDSPSPDNRPYLGNWIVNARANAIGRNLPAMRL